jgi:hypothetical protein
VSLDFCLCGFGHLSLSLFLIMFCVCVCMCVLYAACDADVCHVVSVGGLQDVVCHPTTIDRHTVDTAQPRRKGREGVENIGECMGTQAKGVQKTTSRHTETER